LVAKAFHSVFSIANNLVSPSGAWFLSRIVKFPGPQVGSVPSEQIIFPPVACNADNAALIVGSKAGSGVFI
jgi:hypothetical protein